MAKDIRADLPGSNGQGSHKVPAEVPLARLLRFTFIPVVKRLPTKTHINPRRGGGDSSSESKKTAGQKMTEDGFFKAEVVYIGDSDEGEAGGLGTEQSTDERSTQEETQAQFKMPADHVTQSLPIAPPVSLHTKTCFINTNPLPKLPTLETIPGRPSSAALPCYQVSPGLEVSSASISNKVCGRDERATPVLPQEVANSEDWCPSLASSKESVLSKDWGRPGSCSSTLQLFASDRFLASPCPSVGSGVFSPTVLRVSRHSLASGASLAQTIPSCFSSSDSLVSSPRPLSPSTRQVRHRPPPTQLSLLTAILRKGRLPLLSPSLKRPYSPCWPISSASLSSCHACSVASSLTSITSTLQGSSQLQSPSLVEMPSKPHLPALETLRSTRPPPSPDPTRPTCLPDEQSVSPPLPELHPNKTVTEINHRVTSPKSSHFSSPSSHCSDPVKSTSSGLQVLPPPASNPALFPSFSNLSSQSPKSTSLGDCLQSLPLLKVTPVQEDEEARLLLPLQNGDKGSPVEGCQPSKPTPPPRSSSLSLSLSSFTPSCSSPRPSSCSSVMDCLTPHPCSSSSPALWTRTPSPSLSVCSTASLSSEHGPSECSVDRGGKKRKPYKIKSSYKALAAIPTNTLLLEQQAIDESVENEDLSQKSVDQNHVHETHSEMCSPAQLRQQSEELYAAINEVLENSMPMRRSQSAPVALMKCVDAEVLKFRSFPKSAGRETKYAAFHLQQSAPYERNQTKPGVIRPAPKLQITEDAEEFHPNPFRQYLEEFSENTDKLKVSSRQSEQPVTSTNCRGSPGGPTSGLEKTQNKGWATSELLMKKTKTDEGDTHPSKDAPSKHTPTSLCAAQVESELRETHI